MPGGHDHRCRIFDLPAILEIIMKAINMEFPVILVGLVFLGLVTFTCLANTAVTSQLTAFNQHIGSAINNARFSLMDTLSPHIGSFYSWIPFYCCLILLLAGFDRVKFLRTSLFFSAYLMIAGFCTWLLNMVGSRLLPNNSINFHYNYSGLATMDRSLICVNATLSFGAAIFITLFLDRRFTIIKAALLLFSLVIIYNLIYLGDDLPITLLLGMLAGVVSAICCRYWFKRLSAESTINKLYRHEF